MSAQLPGALHWLAPVLDRDGYAAIIVLVRAEGFGAPLPGQTILIAAGRYAGTGQLNSSPCWRSECWRRWAATTSATSSAGAAGGGWCAAWVALWVLVGYLAGDHIGAIYADFQRYEKDVWAASAVLAVALLVRWLLKRRPGHDAET